jgi:hypothetical protein
VGRGDPEYLGHIAAQDAAYKTQREKEEAHGLNGYASRRLYTPFIQSLSAVPGTCVFEGRTYVRRASQFLWGRPTHFKQVPRDPSKGDP